MLWTSVPVLVKMIVTNSDFKCKGSPLSQNRKGGHHMPYIAIKCYPKDEATKKAVVEKINETFLELWGCPPEAITISLEEIQPDDWKETVVKPEIEPNMDKMMIVSGKKTEKMDS